MLPSRWFAAVFSSPALSMRTGGLLSPLLHNKTYCPVQVRLVSYPRIKLKVDRALDAIAERDKHLRPILRITDLLLRERSESLKVWDLEQKRWDLKMRIRKTSVAGYLRRFPNIFILFRKPGSRRLWCRLSDEWMQLVEEERKYYRDAEPCIVEKLKRLLMMSKHRRICADSVAGVRRVLGFPDDFLTSIVPNYPEFFRLVREDGVAYIELVQWDESFAISEFEKAAKETAYNRRMIEIETRNQPLAFKVSFSPGMSMKKKNVERLAEWQKLPYVSPYQDWTSVQTGTPLSDKRIVALLHEFFCLTVEKKVRLKVLLPFRREFGLPKKVENLLNRYPGIFYMSCRGRLKTFILREGYYYPEPIQNHPLVCLKVKYAEMVYAGPRLVHNPQFRHKEESGEGDEGKGQPQGFTGFESEQDSKDDNYDDDTHNSYDDEMSEGDDDMSDDEEMSEGDDDMSDDEEMSDDDSDSNLISKD